MSSEHAQAILMGAMLGESSQDTFEAKTHPIAMAAEALLEGQVTEWAAPAMGYLLDESTIVAKAQHVDMLAAAYAVRLGLDRVPPDDYLRKVLRRVDDKGDAFEAALYRVGQAHFASETRCLAHIGNYPAAQALWCVWRHPDAFVRCIHTAEKVTNRRVAALAGAVMGARLGLDAIPQDWQQRCKDRTYVLELGERMFTHRSEGRKQP